MKPGLFSFDDWCLLVVSNEKPFKQKNVLSRTFDSLYM